MKTLKYISSVAALVLTCGSLVGINGCSSQEEEEPADTQGALVEDAHNTKGPNDNAAIVEATTILLVSDWTGLDIVAPPIDPQLDPYNRSDPFAITDERFERTYTANLVRFDGIDGKQDWKADAAATWNKRIAHANYQVLDTSKPCGDFGDPHTYLEIERAQLTGAEHKTCGGRMPNEDALDVTINFLVRGPAASVNDPEALHDGVDSATQKSTAAFPYLAEMN